MISSNAVICGAVVRPRSGAEPCAAIASALTWAPWPAPPGRAEARRLAYGRRVPPQWPEAGVRAAGAGCGPRGQQRCPGLEVCRRPHDCLAGLASPEMP